jgi:hypothetical protein
VLQRSPTKKATAVTSSPFSSFFLLRKKVTVAMLPSPSFSSFVGLQRSPEKKVIATTSLPSSYFFLLHKMAQRRRGRQQCRHLPLWWRFFFFLCCCLRFSSLELTFNNN